MNTDTPRFRLIVVGTLLAGGVFALDLSMPLGVAGGVPYVALVLVALWSPRRSDTYAAATIGTVLTILGFFLSSSSGILWMVIVNRLLALFAIWVTALLSLQWTKNAGELSKSNNALRDRILQQSALSEIGQYALASKEPVDVMDHVTASVAEVLDVEFCKVLELLPDDQGLLLRAGVGWKEGYVGQAVVEAGKHSQAGYTLLSHQPVMVDDFRSEKRFEAPALLEKHGVFSGMSVVIHGQNGPIGVLGAHSCKPRVFTEDDINFIQVIANLLAEVIERKRSKVALEESEQRYRIIAETATDAIITINEDDLIVYTNPATETMLGYSVAELLGQPMSILLPKMEHSIHRDRLRQYLERGERSVPWRGRELTAVSKSGRKISVEVSIGEFAEGDTRLFTGIMRDISERKQAQRERQRFEAQAQRSQKLESLEVLAGGVAHDFSNLLVGVLGNAGLILKDLPSTSPCRERLANIETAAQHAADLCKQLLAYAGRGKFVVEPLNINRMLCDMEQLLRTAISKQASLELDLADDLPNIDADSVQIRQVIMNLTTNASEALGNSPGVVSIRTVAVEVDEDYSGLASSYWNDSLAAGSYVCVEVTDTGAGMGKETIAKIFDPFFSTKFTGRGLGLAAVMGIVRGHHGAIDVDSTPGQGTTIRVLLPATDKPEVQTPIRPATEPASKNTATVLVVDDEEIVRTVAKDALEQDGFRVITARDGREGLETFRAHRDEISAVVLDMTMPGLDGKETFRELCHIRIDVPVILSSGYNEHDTISRFVDKKPSHFIQKPYLVQDLISVVRASLQT